jgi:hypothetical protein
MMPGTEIAIDAVHADVQIVAATDVGSDGLGNLKREMF